MFKSFVRGFAVLLVCIAVGAAGGGTGVYLGVEAWNATRPDPHTRGGFDANALFSLMFAAPIGAVLGAAVGIALLAAKPRWLDRLNWFVSPPAVQRRWSEPLDLSSLPRYPGSTG